MDPKHIAMMNKAYRYARNMMHSEPLAHVNDLTMRAQMEEALVRAYITGGRDILKDTAKMCGLPVAA